MLQPGVQALYVLMTACSDLVHSLRSASDAQNNLESAHETLANAKSAA
jgi:hypothetical protein